MADEIRADYDQLEQIASVFSNLAQGIDEMQQRVRGSYAKLVDRGWIGLGSEAFFDEMESAIMPTQQRLGQAFEQASRETQRVAQAIRQAEEEASSLFKG